MFQGVSLERVSSAEHLAAAMREQLLSGEVPPGTKLSDQVMAAIFGVSRHTVREAILILSAEGLVQRSLHKGAVVAELELDDLADVYQARRALELSGLQFAAERNDETWIADLRSALAEMSAAADAGDTQALLDADRVFHETIVAPIGSRRIDRFYRLIQTEIRLTRAWHGARMPPAAFVARHAEIVDALEASQFDLGGQLLRRLIDEGTARLQQELDPQPELDPHPALDPTA